MFAGFALRIADDDVFAAILAGADEPVLNRRRALLRRAARDRVIDAFQIVLGEELGEALMRGVVLGDDDKSGRILIDAMHDARPRDAANAGEAVAAMREQRIDERAVHRAGRGMHGHAAGFVDDDEVFVLEHDIERQVFWLRRGWLGRRQDQYVAAANARLVLRVRDRRAVDAEFTGTDEALHTRA